MAPPLSAAKFWRKVLVVMVAGPAPLAMAMAPPLLVMPPLGALKVEPLTARLAPLV